ncbi:zf-HC2 domain-containing protein [Sandaracinus amylolyticus]|uniref:zf-HC2 domain-containing protein n=1 Tax=Sandaracinus amylolyticus TaxID=927083 RepID=UPI001F21A4C2|nr:zf-HC2 domain-containing protein [Sandaracinus amylolyticus]UJR81120.1 Putative transmembrane anti-sigma factor [Sandaracinus amylolyticus]
MIPCRVVRRHLDALVDGELDTSAQVEFDSHLASCPVCREHAAFARSVKQTIKQELGTVKAPEHLRLRVLTAIQSAPPPQAIAPRPIDVPSVDESAKAPREPRRRRGLRVWMLPARYAVPAAAAAVFFVALGARTDDGEADEAAVAATAMPLFEDVVRRHSSDHPAEVAGPPQQVVGWFRGKLEFPVRPVEFDRADARLLGARLSNIRERDAAAFYYEVRGHRVTVVVFEPPQRAMPIQIFRGAQRVSLHGRELYYRQVRGYTVPVVEHDGLTYAFTGDLDRQTMIQLAASARVQH